MSMESIRKQYRVPAKRGMLVRCVYSRRECKITSATRGGSHLRVRYHNGVQEYRHPFEVDYFVDGEWVSGKEKQQVYDRVLDKWFSGSLKASGGSDDANN